MLSVVTLGDGVQVLRLASSEQLKMSGHTHTETDTHIHSQSRPYHKVNSSARLKSSHSARAEGKGQGGGGWGGVMRTLQRWRIPLLLMYRSQGSSKKPCAFP